MKAVWLQRGADDFSAVEAFIAAKIWGEPRVMPGDTIIVTTDNAGNALGAAIFQNYDPQYGTIEISGAGIGPRWLSRSVIKDMFDYPFRQLECQAVIMRCATDDTRLARILGAYGFKRYDIPRLRGRDCGEAIYVLADDVWRANGFHKETS